MWDQANERNLDVWRNEQVQVTVLAPGASQAITVVVLMEYGQSLGIPQPLNMLVS